MPSLTLEQRLALLGLPPGAATPDLMALLSDWAARCERISAHAKAGLDPFTLAIPAVLSPIGAVNETPWPDFSLARDCEAGGAK
ncbi:hypothetical protein [Pseudogemmobacter sonorensis]|uniref:hypothetical protein n=1 Tax=Pseudogemmobacter sonorensis TaxID=2989681 RepID=UPI0036784D8C